MRILLDTHYLLWSLQSPERLAPAARDAVEDPANDILVSAASIWEIAIKSALRGDDFHVGADQVRQAAMETGFTPLPITAAHAVGVARLPNHHRDPFDRLLIAQAMLEPARLLTADPMLSCYSELVWLLAPVHA